MKKLFFLLFIAVLIVSTGCSFGKIQSSETVNSAITGAATTAGKQKDETTSGTIFAQNAGTETAVTENTATEKETASFTEPETQGTTGKVNEPVIVETTRPASEVSAVETAGTEAQPQAEPEAQPQAEPEAQPQAEPEEQPVSYNPDNVVSLAISKCRAGGMVTTEQHLLESLNAGKITQEDYNEYYPLDGLEESYYSVFVNVDLNKAGTTSGRALGSEEEIAQYIADMLLLESEPVFNIRYTGTTETSDETFYEFRCYR